MPFFGSKKEKQQPPKTGGPVYPQQSPYPSQSTAPAGYGASGEQPPPYTPQGQPPPQYQGAGAPPRQPQYAPPPQQQQQQYYGQPAFYPQQPQYGYAPQGMQYPGAYPMHPQIPPGANVAGHGTFDAGARFNGGAGMNIPPPPPGAMPTAAQYAAAYGGNVTMGQARAGFFSGGSDGGVATHID